MKTVVLLRNNLNGINKHVEDISGDAVLGCKFCSVGVIYDDNYNINNNTILKKVNPSLSPQLKWKYLNFFLQLLL